MRCFLFFLTLACSSLFLTSSASAEAPSATAAQQGTMPLWELQMPSGETLYIVGSIHLLKPDAYPLPDPIEEAFASSPEVVFETDISALNDPAMQMKLLQMGMYQDGTSLEDHVSEETWSKLSEYLEAQGMPPQLVAKFKPWMAALTLSVIGMQKAGYDPNHGLEMYFNKKAKESGKPVSGLEDPMFQINLLANFSGENEEDYLVQTLEDLEELPAYLEQMDEAWRTGNMAQLAEFLNEHLLEFPDIADKLLYDRNEDWATKLDQRIKEGKPAIVIVGAGHLAGEKSLLDLLEQKGYEIQQR